VGWSSRACRCLAVWGWLCGAASAPALGGCSAAHTLEDAGRDGSADDAGGAAGECRWVVSEPSELAPAPSLVDDIAVDDDAVWVAYDRDERPGIQGFLVRLDRDLRPAFDPIPIGRYTSEQLRLAALDGGVAVAWVDCDDPFCATSFALLVQTYDRDGRPRTEPQRVITVRESAWYLLSLAWTGETLLLWAWDWISYGLDDLVGGRLFVLDGLGRSADGGGHIDSTGRPAATPYPFPSTMRSHVSDLTRAPHGVVAVYDGPDETLWLRMLDSMGLAAGPEIQLAADFDNYPAAHSAVGDHGLVTVGWSTLHLPPRSRLAVVDPMDTGVRSQIEHDNRHIALSWLENRIYMVSDCAGDRVRELCVDVYDERLRRISERTLPGVRGNAVARNHESVLVGGLDWAGDDYAATVRAVRCE